MMSDYERVIELQQVAERSQGATMAQMATYMEGMEAAFNKVSVAWEKITTAIADSEVIINMVNMAAGALSVIGDILNTTAGMVGFVTTVSIIGATILMQKLAEHEAQKSINRTALEGQETELKKYKIQLEEKKLTLQTKLAVLQAAKATKTSAKITLQKAKAEAIAANDLAKQAQLKQIELELDASSLSIDEEIQKTNLEINATQAEINKAN